MGTNNNTSWRASLGWGRASGGINREANIHTCAYPYQRETGLRSSLGIKAQPEGAQLWEHLEDPPHSSQGQWYSWEYRIRPIPLPGALHVCPV